MNRRWRRREPCAFINPVSSSAVPEVVIELTPAHDLKVDCHVARGEKPSSIASIQCPTATPLPGWPGPALTDPAPMTFTLPLEG